MAYRTGPESLLPAQTLADQRKEELRFNVTSKQSRKGSYVKVIETQRHLRTCPDESKLRHDSRLGVAIIAAILLSR
eukprot:868525-Amphidinium_carterae.1